MEAYYKYIFVISNIPADSQMGLFTLVHFMDSVSRGLVAIVLNITDIVEISLFLEISFGQHWPIV